MNKKEIANQKIVANTDLKEVIIEVYKGHIEPGLNKKFDTIDQTFERIEKRFEAIDFRFEAIDRRFEAVDRRFDHLEDLMVRQFDELAIFIQRQVQEITGKTQSTDERVDMCESRLTRLEEKVA